MQGDARRISSGAALVNLRPLPGREDFVYDGLQLAASVSEHSGLRA